MSKVYLYMTNVDLEQLPINPPHGTNRMDEGLLHPISYLSLWSGDVRARFFPLFFYDLNTRDLYGVIDTSHHHRWQQCSWPDLGYDLILLYRSAFNENRTLGGLASPVCF